MNHKSNAPVNHKKTPNNRGALPVCLALILFSCGVNAQMDQSKRLTISSDEATMHYHEGYDVYSGHVTVKQNLSKLTGDELRAYRNKQGQVYKVLVNGQPAKLYTQNTQKQKPLHAHAQTMLITPQLHQVLLLGHAHAQQGDNIINAPIINYDTQNAVLKAYHQGNNSVKIASQHSLTEGS